MKSPHALLDGRSLAAQMRPALVKYFQRKTGSVAEAEDLAHEVLSRTLIGGRWSRPEEAKGYVFRAAVNRWRDQRRRLRVRGTVVPWDEAAEAQLGTHQRPPEEELMANEELAQIVRALEELGARTRAVLMLIRLEQMKVASVAKMLGISVSAVNKHLSKGMAHLARVRKEQDAEP